MFINNLLLNAPELNNIIAKFLKILSDNTNNIGVSIILFTILLKVLLTPFDIWQKISQRKQTLGMRRIKPQLSKIQELYKDNPNQFRLEQKKLFKKEKISMFSSFLPLIITMLIFFIVFAGFNKWVKYENEKLVWDLYQKYLAGANNSELADHYINIVNTKFNFFWVKNVFMPDSWASIIPSYKVYAGNGLGAIGAASLNINIPDYYNTLVGPAIYKTQELKRWNGFLILPILSIILSIITSKFLTPKQNQQAQLGPQNKQSEKTQKIMSNLMIYIMPLFIGVLSIFYSTAFSIYLFFSSLYSSILSLIFTIIYKNNDKKIGYKEEK